MEADESMNELIEVPTPKNSCHMGGLQCHYDIDKPGEAECGNSSYPCQGYNIIFVPKVEYLTWKLTKA